MTLAAVARDGVGAPGEDPRKRLIVVTGDPGTGKSTRCRQVARAAREAGRVVRGYVGTDEPDGGGVKRWLEDLQSGERALLGRMATPEAIAAGAPRWILESSTLARCSRVLEEACPADLLVIDEVGPLELVEERGAMEGVRQALAGDYDVALVVVRPWLVGRFLERFPGPRPEIVDAREANAYGRLARAVLVKERT
jgi:nucleoside-triphosphatase